MTAVVNMIPEGQFSNKDLERLLIELDARAKQKEVMHTKEAAAFLGIGVTSIYKVKDLPYHTLPGLEGRVYLKDELIDFIRKH